MSILKQINDKGATIAWSPLRSHPNVLATGTKVSAPNRTYVRACVRWSGSTRRDVPLQRDPAQEGGGGGFDDYGGELSLHAFDFSSPALDGTVIAR